MSRVGVIAALSSEANCFSEKSTRLNQIIEIDQSLLIVSGMGATNSGSAAQKLISAGASHLVSWGTAGALSSAAQPGDLLLPESILSDNGQALKVDHHWRQQLLQQLPSKLKIHHAPLFQSNTVLTNQEQKSQLYLRTSALSVDMESYAIASAAAQKQLPFIVIRSIVDSYDTLIPTSAMRSIDKFGRTKLFSLILNLVKNPSDIPKLILLGDHFKQARHTLKLVTASAGISLAQKSEYHL